MSSDVDAGLHCPLQVENDDVLRIAAAVQWYAERVVSQGKAAEIAGVSRAQFIDELARREVSVSQETQEELHQAAHG